MNAFGHDDRVVKIRSRDRPVTCKTSIDAVLISAAKTYSLGGVSDVVVPIVRSQ